MDRIPPTMRAFPERGSLRLCCWERGRAVLFELRAERAAAADEAVGVISGAFDAPGREVTVTALRTAPAFRGQGVASYLLIVLAAYAQSRGARTITLDDTSDRAWEPRNLYSAAGFRYVNPEPEPEMEGEVAAVVAGWPRFVARRGHDKFWPAPTARP